MGEKRRPGGRHRQPRTLPEVSMTAVSIPPRVTALPAGRPAGGGRLVGWFADRGIRTKLLTAVGVLGVVAIVSGIFAANGIKAASDDLDQLATAQSTISAPVAAIHQNELKARMQVAMLAAQTTPEARAKWKADIAENDAEVEKGIASVDSTLAPYPWWDTFKK